MDHKLLDILVCPICKGRLQVNDHKTALICRADRLSFPIEDGVPVLLEARAQSLAQDSTPGTGTD